MANFFLEQIRIENFGAFTNKNVGPLKPNLNVVYGKNEAGKTTIAKFIDGLLFGWERASATNNSYKPKSAERCGTLFFASRECVQDGHQPQEATLSRAQNSKGLCGDTQLIADIDRETFRTMFSLNSDELRRLNNNTQVTAKLLTAGSGTNESPEKALSSISDEIKTFTSTASAATHSIVNIRKQQEALNAKIRQAEEEQQRCRREKKELSSISPERASMQQRVKQADTKIKQFTSAQAKLQNLVSNVEKQQSKKESLDVKRNTLEVEYAAEMKQYPSELLNITEGSQRSMRDKIETMMLQETKKQHAVDLASNDLSNSTAAYEVEKEKANTTEDAQHAKRIRNFKIGVSAILPLVFIFAGVPLFMHGREISSLSFTVLGLGLVGAAVVLAFAIVILLFKPSAKPSDLQKESVEKARWTMRQDEKKLESCKKALVEFENSVAIQLREMGLGAAQGSLKRANRMLDAAAEVRQKTASYNQHIQANAASCSEVEQALAKDKQQIDNLYENLGLSNKTLAEVERQLDQLSAHREGLQHNLDVLNERYGTLKQKLDAALPSRKFDNLKFEYQELETRKNDSMRRLCVLLLAKRKLEAAIAAWESKSQPEVYRLASQLMAEMTQGVWVKVKMTDNGNIEVESAQRVVRTPLHLSLGTCQQLYLSLRIALLLTAQNVGRNIPIITDDILVNFDKERRCGAARALARLAKSRQVVIMTCHKEIVQELRAADAQVNEIEL